MTASSERMERLAQSVADGKPVDWEKEEREAKDTQEAAIVKRLRTISTLAEVHASDFFMPSAGAAPALTRWGPLEIVKKLGEGAFAEVFLARDPKLEREVALKLLRDRPGKSSAAVYESMLQEARLFARLRHPNVATVYGAEVFEDRPGFWMERIRGKSLDRLLEERGAFGAREAAGIGVEICRALAAVHGAGLVHRDVKTANVMREEGGRIVLMDFGAGRDRQLDAGANMAGTPLYMAPELLQKKPATPQSDLYALGVLLYQLVTRHYPVEADDLKQLLDAHERQESKLLRDRRPDLPEGFVRAVERALAHDATARFRSAGEMERALAESLGISTVRIEEPAASSSRGLWFGVAAMAALAVGVFSFWPRSAQTPTQAIVANTPERSSKPATQEMTPAPMPKEEPKPLPAKPSLYLSSKLFLLDGEKREPIPSGARVRPGDRLALELTNEEPVYLFVFAVDGVGAAYPLFPVPGSSDRNPVVASDARRVPEASLLVMGEGKSEKLLLVASREPNPPLQAEANEKLRHKRVRTLEREPLSTEASERRLKARKGSEPSFPEESAIRKLLSSAEALPHGEGIVGDFWVQVFELELPGRN